ncbi:MAG: hypothetical protein KDI28_02240 [Pseudomonadales bacterium]|nr:hypothetical protein [Pseudomonadales bacterium]MCP5357225.1 hypothetical protein [Pseudomonadales bacterium]
MKDLRKPRTVASIDSALLLSGERQLQHEIRLLQDWIAELEAREDKQPSDNLALSTYRDMLRSREDMLEALRQQAPAQNSAPNSPGNTPQ